MNRSALCLSSAAALGLLLVAGCSSDPSEPQINDVPMSEEQTAPPPTAFPDVSDCEQLEPIVSDFIGELAFDEETSVIEENNLYCAWGSADAEAEDSPGTFTVSIGIGEAMVPDPDSAADVGMDTDSYFSDPALEEFGGIGLWSAGSDGTPGAGGAVIVPSLEIWVSDNRAGVDTLLDQDQLVAIGVALLEL